MLQHVMAFMRDDAAAMGRLARTCRLCAEGLRPFLVEERGRRLVARLALDARRFWLESHGVVHASRVSVARKTGRVVLRERVVHCAGVEPRLTVVTPDKQRVGGGHVLHVAGARVVPHRYESLLSLARFLHVRTLAGGAWGPWVDMFEEDVVPPASELRARALDLLEFILLRDCI